MTLEELCTRLLPSEEHLQFETLLMEDHHISLITQMTAPKAACPDCHELSYRIHSGYSRKLADLPWAAMPVCLILKVRRFFCDSPLCRRQTFTERVPTVASHYVRTTTRLHYAQATTGLAMGGSAGARQLARQHMLGSRNTVLRRVCSLPAPEFPPPEVVGIDDWSWRKGQRYGTIVVDLERGCPIDVLADRLADTVASWLKAHPQVKIVARDRSDTYAAGIRQGAPGAVQVADRFHLMQNLAETLEQVLSAHHEDLDAIDERRRQEPVRGEDGTVAVPVALPPRQPIAEELAEQRRARRIATFEKVWALRQQAWSGQAIARHLGIGKATVFRDLRSPIFPERKGRSDRGKRSLLRDYKDYLVKRWNEGCQEALELFHEIQSQGYGGSYATVARYVRRLRQSQGQTPRPYMRGGPKPKLAEPKTPQLTARTATWAIMRRLRQSQGQTPRPYMRGGPKPKLAEPKTPQLTARTATWAIMRREDKRDDEDQDLIHQLHEQDAELAEAIDLSEGFADLVRHRQPEDLDGWLERASQSGLRVFQRFAGGLRDDYPAVKAGLTRRWSNGPVEGQINRLKMIKRRMFGRANIDLLKLEIIRICISSPRIQP